MTCPDIETLERLASKPPKSAEEPLLREHIASCVACQERLALVRDNLRVARRVAGPPEPSRTTRAEDMTQTVSNGASAMQAAATAPALPGYQILREISRGGQGVVYQAIQQSTKRKVAIKVLRDGHFADASERARFDREVQILGQLKHSNVVSIYDSGRVGGNAFYVMDYVSGKPLDEYVAESKIGVRDVLSLFAKICDAVHAAHLKGIIHRDLKPSNIRLDQDGEPRVLDFGLAKLAGATELSNSPAMTMTGQFLGSLPWSSPEQAEGQPGKIDIRTDVYSLGVILYQLLTGRFPYEVAGTMRDVLDRIMHAEPASPRASSSSIDDEVATIILKCLSKERERRYQSAGELARDIQHYLVGEPIEAKRDSAGYVLRKALRRYRVPVAFLGMMVFILIGTWIALAAAFGWVRQERDRADAAAVEQKILREQADVDRARAVEAEQLAQRRLEDMTAAKQAEEKARIAAERSAYSANILAADAAARSDEFDELRRRLAACPEAFRGWEWNWLALQADTSIAWSAEGGRCERIELSEDRSRLYGWGVTQPLTIWDAVNLEALTSPAPASSDSSTSTRNPPRGPLSFSLASMRALNELTNLAAGKRMREFWIEDVRTGRRIQTFDPAEGLVSAQMSPDGRWLLASTQYDVSMWAVDAGSKVWSSSRLPRNLSRSVFSPDGRRLAFGVTGLEMVDSASGETIWRDGKLGVIAMAFDRSGGRIACSESLGKIIVLDAARGARLATHVAGRAVPANCLAFDSSGSRIAAAQAGVIFVLGPEPGSRVRLSGHSDLVRHMVFAADDRRLYASTFDGIRVWDVDATLERSRCLFPLDVTAALGCSLAVDSKSSELTFDDARQTVTLNVTTSSFQSAVTAWDAPRARIVARSSDGRRAVRGSGSGLRKGLTLTDAAGNQIVELGTAASSPLTAAFSADSRRVACTIADPGGDDGVPSATVAVFDASDGRPVFVSEPSVSGSLNALDLNFDGTRVAFAPSHRARGRGLFGKESCAIVLDVASGKPICELLDPKLLVSRIALGGDGRRVVTAAFNVLAVWDASDGTRLATLAGHDTPVTALALSPDGRRVAAGAQDGVIRLWDLETFEPLVAMREHRAPIGALCFFPGGERLASAGQDALRVFDGRTPEAVRAERNSPEYQARRLVDSTLDREILVTEALACLRRDASISPEVREAALRQLEAHTDDPERCNTECWAIVKHAMLDAELYRKALRKARTATRVAPEHGLYLNSRGVAEFRVGKYREALETLRASERLNRVQFEDGHPADVAFIAMCQHELGMFEEARANLTRLRQLCAAALWQGDTEAQLFLRDAELLLEAPGPAGESAPTGGLDRDHAPESTVQDRATTTQATQHAVQPPRP